MVIRAFPPIECADPLTGLLALGGDLEVESLLLAYRSGIFPWPYSDEYITWFAPAQRAIFESSTFHISKSTWKLYRNKDYTFTANKHFHEVISACADPAHRRNQSSTWITPEMIQAYCRLHEAGHAHSLECYHLGKLIGGLYGVSIGGMFAAESMFHSAPNGSKLALTHLVRLLSNEGIGWFDVQVLSPFLQELGAIEIPRESFMEKLKAQLSTGEANRIFRQEIAERKLI